MSISSSDIRCYSKESQAKSPKTSSFNVNLSSFFKKLQAFSLLKNDVRKTFLIFISLRMIKVCNIVYPFTTLDLKYLDHVVVEATPTWKMLLYLIGEFNKDISVAAVCNLNLKRIELWNTLLYVLIPLQTYIILKLLALATDGFFIINIVFLSKPLGFLFGLAAFKLYWGKIMTEAMNYWNESMDETSANSISSTCNSHQQSILVEYNDDEITMHSFIKSSASTPICCCAAIPITNCPTSERNSVFYLDLKAVLFVQRLLNNLKAKIIYLIIRSAYDSLF